MIIKNKKIKGKIQYSMQKNWVLKIRIVGMNKRTLKKKDSTLTKFYEML